MNKKNQFSGLMILSAMVMQAQGAEFNCPNTAAPVEVQYGDTVNCSIESTSDVDVYAINMTKDDRVSVSASQTVECLSNGVQDGFDPYLQSYDPSSQQVGSSLATCPAGTRVEFTAKQSGIYTISIKDRNGRTKTGKYQMQFQCVSGPCISHALIERNECVADFDGSKLKVPYIQYGADVYAVNFNLINSSFQFQLTDYSKR